VKELTVSGITVADLRSVGPLVDRGTIAISVNGCLLAAHEYNAISFVDGGLRFVLKPPVPKPSPLIPVRK
jgi:hypothetical protein